MKKKLRVLEVLDCYFPSIDGPVQCVSNYANCLIKNNCDVEVLVPHYPKYKDNQQFKVHRIFSIKGADGYRTPLPIFSKKARKVFKNGNFDIVHVHSPFTLGRFACKMAKKYKIPVVLTVHTKYKSDFERTLKSKFLQNFMMKYILKTMNMSDLLLTVSNGAKQEIINYGYTKDIQVVRNGTDFSYPNNASELKNYVDKKYNLTNENMVFLFVGRIVKNKNIDFSLQVLKVLKEKGYNFKFVIVGDGEYKKELEKTIENFNLTENIIFTGKIYDRQELSGLYLRSDLFLFPSTFDTFGIVALESATMKTPAFMIKDSCASEVVVDGFNGFTEVEDVNKWVNKLEKCFEDKSLITNMKENCYNTIYQSWTDITDQIYQIYIEIINKNKQ